MPKYYIEVPERSQRLFEFVKKNSLMMASTVEVQIFDRSFKGKDYSYDDLIARTNNFMENNGRESLSFLITSCLFDVRHYLLATIV